MSVRHERAMHRAACLVGGYAAIYTVLMRMSLGSSQTVNLLEALSSLLSKCFAQAFLFFLGSVIYGASVFAASYLKQKGKADVCNISAVINIAGFVILGVLPTDIPPVVGLYPTFIMMSFMWVVFGSMGGYASAPIFSTNNFRQTVGSIAEYCADGDKKHLDKAKYFAGTLLMFHIGAAAGYAGCLAAGKYAAFFGILPCAVLLAAVNAPKLVSLVNSAKSHSPLNN